ncbi:TMV resistance protein N-like [Fagus crenata]
MDTESASSSSATHGRKYDVFLSFRGTDTRTNFTDHLYAALNQKCIFTFRDDEELERGTVISPELLKAIEESRFAIVILSKDYASSSWCLTELAKIIECMKKTRLIVVPVFYHVDPSDVRNQKGTFAEAFAKHEERSKDNILDTWRAALTEVANLSGYHLHDQPEAKVIEEIVGKIFGKLAYSIVDKDLVGINSRMEKLVNLLGMGLNDVRFIGIWGMGGIGKTTLAGVVYDRFCDDFDGSSFLANVREESGKHGLVSLQKRLLSDVLFWSTDFQGDQRRLRKIIRERLVIKEFLSFLMMWIIVFN